MTPDRTQLIAGVVLLILGALAGAKGGSVLGYRVETEACAACRLDLAACEARAPLVLDALEEARAALVTMRQECRP